MGAAPSEAERTDANGAAGRARVLFLVNAAHGTRPFFAEVGAELARMGFEPLYAVDSHFTEYLHPNVRLAPAHVFSEYFAEHADRTELPDAFAGTNVSRLFFSDVDRLTWTRAGKRRGDRYYEALVANLAWFFRELFERERPRLVVYENVSNSFAAFAQAAAGEQRTPFLGIMPSRLPGRIDLVDASTSRNSAQPARYRELLRKERVLPQELAREVDHYLLHFDAAQPDYMHRSRLEMGPVARYASRASLERGLGALRYARETPTDLHFAYQVPHPYLGLPEQLFGEVARRVKLGLLRRLRYDARPRTDRPYFLYPIQFHPESSTSVDGPDGVDEWSNILRIVRNLPHGTWLYVKDHRHAAGRPPLGFYERVQRLPNVLLVHPECDQKALIRASIGVICTTGTLGWEALVLGKPVLAFGEPFYAFYPGCVRLDPAADLHHELENARSRQSSAAEIRALVESYFLCSEPGTLNLEVDAADAAKVRWIADLVRQRVARPDPEAKGGRIRAEVTATPH